MRHVRGTLFSIAAVALVTGAVYALRPVAPVLSLGALYVFAVLPVAVLSGLAYAIAVAVGSQLVFNFLFLPPVHTLALRDSENWVALAVYLVIAVVVSELAASARRRAQEASLLAEVATSLFEHGSASSELGRVSQEVESLARHDAGARRRLGPALDSLLEVAADRERLAGEALEAEALRRADMMKTALLRAVSHDLRTPLMAISTSAGALARSDLSLDDADRRELLETTLAASQQLDHLVGNLLDLSRLQAGAAQPDQALTGLEELVIAALDELGVEGSRVQVTFADESLTVRVDPHQIQRVLVNLLENAIKYSPLDESVRVQVSATPSEAVVRVIDHGPGVPPEERERIFEPFQRGSRGTNAPGAGLGLAIARGFTEANDGRLTVESRSGQGATFVLSLPATRAGVPA
jgi:two-component system, OmpR family, sensor histidine kinase KdpD